MIVQCTPCLKIHDALLSDAPSLEPNQMLPTGTRTLVTATYPPEQELSRLDGLILQSYPLTTPEPTESVESSSTPVPFSNVDVQLIEVTTFERQITTRLRIYNGHTMSVSFTPDDIWLALGYAPDPPGPRNPAEGMQSFELLPEQAVDLILIWYWADEPYASMGIGEYRFAIQLRR